ncbi:hypothetical protein PSYJA_08168 [Pseudomonas syringae pv. japonica str. M301072]|uniref:Uncharacterized protein n=1 Tax=Pseudomonas syringae pv. japonica str. M301072 TaxID=629262 RepID=F3FFF5_PSESX|nr:hypothetical protein PSYJA_08168 [Pseudomonas syringae pv. japonica str. M301072]
MRRFYEAITVRLARLKYKNWIHDFRIEERAQRWAAERSGWETICTKRHGQMSARRPINIK